MLFFLPFEIVNENRMSISNIPILKNCENLCEIRMYFKSEVLVSSNYQSFELNYRNLMIPFDQLFNTYHDGSDELHNKMIKRLKINNLNKK